MIGSNESDTATDLRATFDKIGHSRNRNATNATKYRQPLHGMVHLRELPKRSDGDEIDAMTAAVGGGGAVA